jgi:hypothetical protein
MKWIVPPTDTGAESSMAYAMREALGRPSADFDAPHGLVLCISPCGCLRTQTCPSECSCSLLAAPPQRARSRKPSKAFQGLVRTG